MADAGVSALPSSYMFQKIQFPLGIAAYLEETRVFAYLATATKEKWIFKKSYRESLPIFGRPKGRDALCPKTETGCGGRSRVCMLDSLRSPPVIDCTHCKHSPTIFRLEKTIESYLTDHGGGQHQLIIVYPDNWNGHRIFVGIAVLFQQTAVYLSQSVNGLECELFVDFLISLMSTTPLIRWVSPCELLV